MADYNTDTALPLLLVHAGANDDMQFSKKTLLNGKGDADYYTDTTSSRLGNTTAKADPETVTQPLAPNGKGMHTTTSIHEHIYIQRYSACAYVQMPTCTRGCG